MNVETQREARGHDFYPANLDTLPKPYSNESTPLTDQVIHLHYFVAGCDWWITEYDPSDNTAFGYVCLGDPQNAEWGYIALAEVEAVSVPITINGDIFGSLPVERDLYWEPKAVRDANLPGSAT